MLTVSLNRLTSLLLLSGSGLILEIALTRLLASIYFPPYVFAVLALAILGIGLGAAVATWQKKLRQDAYIPRFLALAAVSTLVLVLFVIFATSLDLQALLFVLVVLPYIFIGLTLVTIFSTDSNSSPQLYMADLVGAGVGAVLAIPLMDMLGPVDSLLVVAVLFALAGYIAHPADMPRLETIVLVLSFVFLGSSIGFDWLTLDMAAVNTDKPIAGGLSGGRVVETIWESFARTDVVEPGDGGPFRLYIDGAAASIMPRAGDERSLLRDIGLFAFVTAQPESVLVIGPGGGLDISHALRIGARKIVAVEVNPASVRLVKGYSLYNGGLYDNPAVRVVVDEGRSLLRREDAQYDLIYLSQVVTLAAERSGYALTENTIYTVEAFEDYLAHLTPDGLVALKLYDDPTLMRAFSTAMDTLRRQGLSDTEALDHTAAFRDMSNNPPIPLLLIRTTPFSRDELLSMQRGAINAGFEPLFLPQLLVQPPFDTVQAGTQTFSKIVEDFAFDISPTTDNRPFFYQFERGVPGTLEPLLKALVIIVIAGGVLLIYAQRRVQSAARRWAPLYFAALGSGFIIVEIAIIQQTRLFLGHPTVAITAVLAVLLMGGGVGSWIAGRWIVPRFSLPPAWIAIAVAALLVIWILVWPLLSDRFLVAESGVRLLIVVLSLLPLALLMGMPFPLGLLAVGQAGDEHVALAWAVNGITTVVGSVVSVTLAILSGFNSVLLLGILAYLVAGATAHFVLAGRIFPSAAAGE